MPTTTNDPAALAQALRTWALDARRLLNDPEAPGGQGGALATRGARLQDEALSHASPELTRWLENARRRVEAA